MTETEKQAERDAKSNASAFLLTLDLSKYRYALEDTDERLRTYVDGVILHPDDHNIDEVLGLVIFFRKLDMFQWSAKAVRKFIVFYETCKFSGLKGRQSYKLIPFQVFLFANIFGFKGADGLRLTRDVILFIPRKASKTTSVAALVDYELLFSDANAQAFVGANSYKQAQICFREVKGILKGFDTKMKHFKINREKIECLIKGHESSAECLAANPDTLDGLNASLVIMDEYSQARNTEGKKGSELKNVLVSSMGARPEPLTVTITTASDVIDGPFVEELEYAQKVLRGEVEDWSMFTLAFHPDVDDDEGDPHTWAKVQPMLGYSVRSDYYERYWKRAHKSADDLFTFRTKQLNVFSRDERTAWIPFEKAKEMCRESLDPANLKHRYDAMVAFDLSIKDDFSAVSFMWYSPSDKKFRTHVKYYFPEGQMDSHPNAELYRIWAEQGYLTLCSGDCIDVNMIAKDIMATARYLRILKIGYDSYKAKDLVNLLAATGGKGYLSPVPQTYGAFNLPVESFEMMAYMDDPRILIDNNPINAYCLSNCVLDEDRLENKKPIKRAHNQKIDGAICMLMCISLFNSYVR